MYRMYVFCELSIRFADERNWKRRGEKRRGEYSFPISYIVQFRCIWKVKAFS